MANQFPRRQKDLIAALQDFIKNVDKLDKHQVTKGLEAFSSELTQLTNANSTPQTQIHTKTQPAHENPADPAVQATMHYPNPQALTRELPALLDLRGISLITQERPPLMDWLNLRITCDGKNHAVQLLARVVQYTSNGIALEVETANPQVRDQLILLAQTTSSPNNAVYNYQTHNTPPKTHTKFLESEGEPLNRYNLEQTDLETILLEIAHRRGFGLLQIQHAQHTWQLVYLHHQLVDVQRFPLRQEESLPSLLLESKNITREQYDNVHAYAKSHDTEPENALVALDYLTEKRLAQAHKARTMLLLQRLLQRTTGHVAHYGLTYPPPIQNSAVFNELALASIPARVFHHIHARYQKLDNDRLIAAAEHFQNHTLTLNPSLQAPLNALGLDDELNDLACSLTQDPEKQPQTLSQLIQSSPLPPSKIIALCLALEKIDLITLKPLKRACPTPEPPPTNQDHFSRLGLHWSTYDQEIQRTYHRLNQYYQESDLLDDPQHASTFDQITKAYEEIRTPTQRTTYRNNLVDPYTLQNALTDFRNKAENAKLNRDIDIAIDACCRIIELDPDDPNAREDLKTLRPLKLWSNSQHPPQAL